jgi:hypothetical protein
MLLIDFDAVKTFSRARNCEVKRLDKLTCEMTGAAGATALCRPFDEKGISWNVLDVFKACHLAREGAQARRRPGNATPPKELDTERHWGREHRLQEAAIAEALAADGIWPYSSKRRTNALDALLASETRGGFVPTADVNPRIKMAVRAVIDAGLADHVIGPRGGLYVCIRWTPAARRPPEPPAPPLTPEEEVCIARLA